MFESRRNNIIMYVNPALMLLAHIIYARLFVGIRETWWIFAISAVIEFGLFGSLFVIKRPRVTKRVYYILLIIAAYAIGTILHTQVLIPMVFVGIALMLSLFMDRRLQIEYTLVAAGSLLTYYPPYYHRLKISGLIPRNSVNVGIFILFLSLYIAITVFALMGINDNQKMLEKLEEKAAAAEAANDSKDAFLANMSHEIRTPMASIKGMSDLLSSRDVSPIEKEYVSTIQSSSDELLGIIDDILDYSKIASGELEFESENYSITSILYNIKNMVNPRLKGSDVAFLMEIDPDFPAMLIGDSARVEQLIYNVIDNSIKFTKHGTIHLAVKWVRIGDRAEVFVNVTDTGLGIEQSRIDTILDAFSSAEAKANRRNVGTGLGLSTVKCLCEHMDGGIDVISTIGEGTIVKMNFFQEVADFSHIVSIERPRDYKIYLYEPRRAYSDVFMSATNSLFLDCEIIREPAYFSQVAKDTDKTIFFFDYDKGIAQVRDIEQNFNNVVLVGMTDNYSKVTQDDEPGFIVVQKPLTAMSMTTALRRERVRVAKRTVTAWEPFRAPGIKVCIVDDNEVNLKVAEGILGKYDLQITTMSSGYECLKQIEYGAKYDIVFMDYMMPQMDGVETCRRIRRVEQEKGIESNVLIALTANAVTGAEKSFIGSGFDGYLSKPIAPLDLDEILRKYIPVEARLEPIPAEKLPDEPMQQAETDDLKVADAVDQVDTGKYKNIDLTLGLKNMGDDQDIYIDVASTALREGRKQITKIREYYESGDMDSYIILVHGIKSGMAGLGAVSMSEHAKAHEFAGKEGRFEYIASDVNALIEHFGQVLEELEVLLADLGVNLASDSSQETEQAMDRDDAVAAISSIMPEVKAMIKNELRGAIEALDSFDQEEAMSHMNAAKEASAVVYSLFAGAFDSVEMLEYQEASDILEEVIATLEE